MRLQAGKIKKQDAPFTAGDTGKNTGMKKNTRRMLFIAAGSVVALAAAGVFGLHAAAKVLKEQVEAALGTDSEVGEIVVNWSSVEARDVRIRAPKGWPVDDALRARRIIVRPDLAALFSARIHVPDIIVEQPYVSVLRTQDGKLRLLPGLLERKPDAGKDETGKDKDGKGAPPNVSLGRIELREGVLEFFDATVRHPPYRTRLEQLHAIVEDLQLPSLAGRTSLQIDGSIRGLRRNGKLSIAGWAELATKNSDIATRLSGVDLLALQPYLIKTSEIGVKQGTLDLTMKSTVRNNQLHAPGTVTLSRLELAPGNGALGTFMGVPRQAVVAALKDRKDQIAIKYVLEGNLNDPKFSLNESFSRRIGAAVADNLGISFEGLTRGVGGTIEGLGGAVKKLFGR